MVRVLISYRLFCVRSFSESVKSSATASAETPESEPLGDREDMTSGDGARGHVTEQSECFLWTASKVRRVALSRAVQSNWLNGGKK